MNDWGILSDLREASWQSELIVEPEWIVLGHYVIRLDIPWIQTPFPLQGVLVDTQEKRDWFIEHCQWVVVDTSKRELLANQESEGHSSDFVAAGVEVDPDHPINSLKGSRLNGESVGASLKAYSLLDRQARRLINSMIDRGPAEIKAAEKVVGELSDFLQRNLAAMVWLTRIKDRDDYTAKHSINSAVLALGLAHALEWPLAEVERAGLAALLHDVGNVAVDAALLEKTTPLSEAEFEQVKRHTFAGQALLQEEPGIDDAVARVAGNHHERLDGSGYPQGLTAESIDELSRLVAIVDVYDALTSDRPFRPARSHHDALGALWRGRNSKFDKQMVETFIQFMGWVVPGTLVQLSDRSLAIVEETTIGQGLHPIVRRLVKGPLGFEAAQRLDLARLRDQAGAAPGNDPDEQSLRIEEVLPDGARGIKVKSLLVAMLADAQ